MDPILTLQVSHDDSSILPSGNPSAVITSLCFLNSQQPVQAEPNHDRTSDSDSDGDIDDLNLQCERLVHNESRRHTASARQVASALSLAGRFIGTCHSNGDNFLWDLGQRKISQELTPNRGPGLALRRLDNMSTTFLYQTRDTNGTVSLHDAMHADRNCITAGVSKVVELETQSQTFCAAAPCAGNSNLVALPSAKEYVTVVRDWRVQPHDSPIAMFHGDGGKDRDRKHGMLTSLAMTETTIACGMESGTVFFHDLAMIGKKDTTIRLKPCSLSLGKDPILSLDMTPSSGHGSVVAIAGLAGSLEDLAELPSEEQGRVAVVKASLRPHDDLRHARLRSRISTRDALSPFTGKPGVALCRFRPDRKVFAVGGWDKRLRIFDRSSAAPLAILRGHAESVNAMSWAHDSPLSGLLATGSSDGKLHVWRCFASNKK